MDYPSEDHAKHAVELFQGEIQELKVVPKSL
jgi:septal ring-binding cell division protein DamX